jgi:hypothetical protein
MYTWIKDIFMTLEETAASQLDFWMRFWPNTGIWSGPIEKIF